MQSDPGLPKRFIWTILVYVLLGPLIGATVYLCLPSVDQLPPGELLQVFLPFAGLTYILSTVPALAIGFLAGWLRRREVSRYRIVIPVLVAVVLVPVFIAEVVLAPSGAVPPPGFLLNLATAGGIAALIAGGVSEFAR